jgi:CheY-like chemotaxis protein
MVASLLPPDEVPAGTEEFPPDPLRAAVLGGRVLLLEDDPDFNVAISDFLTENGYTVVAVANGGDGVREVLMGDFAAVICDLMMPTLPGDMFYRAIERIRPELCLRLIFMTGYAGQAEQLNSMGIVNPRLLMKPFHLDELLDLVAVVQLASFFAEMQAQIAPPAPSESVPVAAVPRHPSHAGTSRPQAVLRPAAEIPAGRGGLAFAAACAALVLAAVVILGVWYSALWQRAEELTTDLAAAEREEVAVAREAAVAEKSRAGLEALLNRPRLIAAERATGKWAAALEGLAVSVGPEIEIQSIQAGGAAKSPRQPEMQIEGVSIGSEAMAAADRFRAAVQTGLERRFDGAVETRFTVLEEEKTAAPAGDARARFVLMATVGARPETPVAKWRVDRGL